jgi:hypothetical protein
VSDRLFDPQPYGGVKQPRARAEPEPEPMVRVTSPWVLLRSTSKRPVAHRWTRPGSKPGTLQRNSWGAAIADCGAQGATVSVDGEPLAIACPLCLRAGAEK